MLSQLTSFFWGSASADSIQDVGANDLVQKELEGMNGGNEVMAGITDLNQLRLSPLSMSSINTEEETDWVMVGTIDKPSQADAVSVDSSNVDPNRTLSLRKDSDTPSRRRGNQNNNPQTRSGNIYSAASVLNAIQAVRPQQKAMQRVHQEQYLKRNQLDRSNKVQMVESCSKKPLKRRNRYTPTLNSRAVNNRRC